MTRAELHDIVGGHQRFTEASAETSVEQRRQAGAQVVRVLGRDCRDVLEALGITHGNTREEG